MASDTNSSELDYHNKVSSNISRDPLPLNEEKRLQKEAEASITIPSQSMDSLDIISVANTSRAPSLNTLFTINRCSAGGNSGLFLAFLSGILMTIYSSCYKIIKKDINLSAILLLRGMFQMFLMGSMIMGLKDLGFRFSSTPEIQPGQRINPKCIISLILSLVAACAGFRLLLIFGALKRIYMANVHTILNGSPVLVMIFSHFVLNDRCNIIRSISTVFLVGGVVLIFQPYKFVMLDSFEEDIGGYFMAIGALVLSALGSVFTKKISSNLSKQMIAFILGIAITIVGFFSIPFQDPSIPLLPTDGLVWGIAVVVAILGVLQQFCIIGKYFFYIA
uniref:EamA domain-containing protein n=1 Tax=Lepeophtheirus salmonis TaxID=72036 RepID=A0A0K2V7Z2_LEPSM